MADPEIAQRSPYQTEVEAGKNYAWCACGRSKKQPFCDGSHTGTGLAPVWFRPEKSGTVWLCGCKNTKKKPFCDSTHKSLPE